MPVGRILVDPADRTTMIPHIPIFRILQTPSYYTSTVSLHHATTQKDWKQDGCSVGASPLILLADIES